MGGDGRQTWGRREESFLKSRPARSSFRLECGVEGTVAQGHGQSPELGVRTPYSWCSRARRLHSWGLSFLIHKMEIIVPSVLSASQSCCYTWNRVRAWCGAQWPWENELRVHSEWKGGHTLSAPHPRQLWPGTALDADLGGAPHGRALPSSRCLPRIAPQGSEVPRR